MIKVKFKKEVIETFERVKMAFANLLNHLSWMMDAAQKKSGLPASTVASGKVAPLRLDLQFFAEEPSETGDGTDPNNGGTGDSSGDGGDDEELTLTDLLKTNPKIKQEYKEKVAAAVNKRFKNYDFDPDEARAALAEKKQRDEARAAGNDEDTVAVQTAEARAKKLEARAKNLAVAAFAAKEGLDPNLISRLAADKVEALQFDDALNLDEEELEDIVDGLRQEFPSIFPAAGDDQNPPPGDDAGEGTGKITGSRINPGSTQKLNNPPGSKPDPREQIAATLEKLRKTNRF